MDKQPENLSTWVFEGEVLFAGLDSGFWTGLDSGFWTGLWTGLLVLAGGKPLLKNQEPGASL